VTSNALVIRHLPETQRFAADIDGASAYLSYRELEGRILDFNHTFVPVALRGGGIASQLTEHALRFARFGGFRVLPSCPFVAAYIRRHSEHRALLA
jgi:predicted GNAT family acetyltransferase